MPYLSVFDLQPQCRQVQIEIRAEGIEDLANVHLVHMSTAFVPSDVIHRSSSQGDGGPATQRPSSSWWQVTETRPRPRAKPVDVQAPGRLGEQRHAGDSGLRPA